MIDGALQSMIDEVLLFAGKIIRTAVELRTIQRHLLVIPGQPEGLHPESRSMFRVCF
jgi:hypothetical protein